MQVPTSQEETPSLSKGQLRRRDLLDVTLRIIAGEGIEAVTHRRVAEEAGVSRGATTYHFSSRDEIVLEAFRYYIRIVAEQLEEAMERVADDDVEGIIDVLVLYQQREFLQPQLVLAEYELILYAARNRALGDEVRAWERGLVENLAAAFRNAGVPDPFDAASLVLGVFRAFELECLTFPGTEPSVLRERLRSLLAGWVATHSC